MIIIATPCYDGRLDVRYTDSLIQTIRNVPDVHPIFIPGDAMIQRARNDLFKIAYQSKADTLVWIDSDEAWSVEDFITLVEDPRDFVTGLVRQKTDTVTYCIRSPKEDTVESCGMGFCKMSRAVMNELWNNSEEYTCGDTVNRSVFEIKIINGELYSEDIAACKKWSGKIYFNPKIMISHIGTKVYN